MLDVPMAGSGWNCSGQVAKGLYVGATLVQLKGVAVKRAGRRVEGAEPSLEGAGHLAAGEERDLCWAEPSVEWAECRSCAAVAARGLGSCSSALRGACL